MNQTIEQDTYNGWTNRETWLVGVWDFFDIEGIEEMLKDTVEDKRIGYEVIADNPELGGLERALTLYLADWLEREHEIILEDVLGSGHISPYLRDHLNGSVDRINWLEIAEHYEEEIKVALEGVKVTQ